MIFQRFLAHDVIDVLFPFVFGFSEFVDSFAKGAKEFGNFLGTEKKKNDKKNKNHFSAAEVSKESKSV